MATHDQNQNTIGRLTNDKNYNDLHRISSKQYGFQPMWWVCICTQTDGRHNMHHLVATPVGEVEFCFFHPKRHAWLLHHQLHVDGFARLYPDHKFIALNKVRTEDVARHVAELYPHLCLSFIQCCNEMKILQIC